MLDAAIYLSGTVAVSIALLYWFHSNPLIRRCGRIATVLFVLITVSLIYWQKYPAASEPFRKDEAAISDQTWRPPVIHATHSLEGDKVRLSLFLGRDSRAFDTEIMCSVTDPDDHVYWSKKSGPSVTASATEIDSFSFYVSYPFGRAPSLRPGVYKVHWFIATDSRQVIATDSFEVRQKN
jgi:hypothetical protein